MVPCRCHERHDGVVVCHDIIFGKAQLEIEHVEELALYPANIALAKYTGTHCPVYVFER